MLTQNVMVHLQVWGQIFNCASVENYYSTRLFIAKGNSPPRAEGQRWEAQRVAEQCLETGGMMFERSEFLPPQALRQAASGEVWTDWRILQQLMLMQFVNLLCKSTTLTAYSRAQCRRSLHRTGCEKAMLSTFSTECRTRLPCFWYFFKKVQKERVEEKYKWTIKVEDCCRIWRRAKVSFLPPNLQVSLYLPRGVPKDHVRRRGAGNSIATMFII